MNPIDTEFQLLETLGEAQKTTRTVSQRDLAKLSGLSLGMTNMLVKRFVSRGWVKLVKASGHTWFYALTPEGIDEIASRTYGFLRRTASTVKNYYDRIDSFVRETKEKGFECIVYDAPFEIEFVFRYACSRHGLFFMRAILNPSRRNSRTPVPSVSAIPPPSSHGRPHPDLWMSMSRASFLPRKAEHDAIL
jgi:DNA-binding MarR family transcriptional regulator